MTTALVLSAVLILAYVLVVWVISLPLRDTSIVDVAWGPGFVIPAGVGLWATETPTTRAWLVLALTAIWGIRLGWHIGRRRIGKRMLERLGYEVFTATGGAEVLDMFEKNPERYDLVIIDMTMPEMNGLELSQKLLEIYEDIPIIICTGHNDLVSSEISGDIAIRDYVIKPFVRYEIASIIRGVLD